MLIFEERGKPLEAEQIPNNQLNPLVAEPGPRRWKAIAINTTPSLLPLDHGAKLRNRLFKNNCILQQQKRRRREWISMMAMIMIRPVTRFYVGGGGGANETKVDPTTEMYF